ncbi:MAG: HEAT repeat domain-containing protein [Verrucomicrobia bacterium]|nr:HEAT repeat domain-containing protein [Verrucomicrobiota bacterium]
MNEQSVPAFMVVLKDRKEPLELRTVAFEGYWKLASNSVTFAADFSKILQDRTEPLSMREQAGQMLQRAAVRSAEEVLHRSNSGLHEVEERLAKARDVRTAFEIGGNDIPVELTRALTLLEKRKESLAARRSLSKWLLASPWGWILLLALPPLICGPLWLLLLWLAPLRLWKISRILEKLPGSKSPAGNEVPFRLQNYLLISFLQYHPRVLDAWLEQHWPKATRAFNALGTSADRNLHLPVPVRTSDGAIVRPTPVDFKGRFEKSRTILTICGEPGSGKTSLACQLARWAMAEKPEERITKNRLLPVFISEEHDLRSGDNGPALIELVSRKVQALCGDTPELSANLLDRLLKEGRILVVVDGVSEMSDGASACLGSVCEGHSPIRALIVTSRIKDWLRGTTFPDALETPGFQAETLSEFLGAFLTLRGNRSLFADREIFEGCLRLLEALDGRHPSALQARMFAELLIGSKESGRALVAPGNQLDLVLRYLGELNRRVPSEERLDDALLLQLVKAVAWDCLKTNFYPAAVDRNEMLTTLRRHGGEESHLRYLEAKLPLLRPVDGEFPRLRFSIGVLVEHLAACHAVETFGGNGAAWSRFLEDAACKAAKLPPVKSFILTLRDVCLVRGEQFGVPESAEIELGRLAGLDPAGLDQARVRRKLDRLVEQLSHADARQRKAAALKVADLGCAAAAALPALIDTLQNSQESAEVREAVVAALGEIGAQAEGVTPILLATLRHGEAGLQGAAARALPRLGQKALAALIKAFNESTAADTFKVAALASLGGFEQERPAALSALIQILRDCRQSERVRVAAAETLGRIGAPAEVAVADLIELMKENKALCQTAAKALLEIAPDAKPAILALVETLNPTQAPSPREILATFRRTLVQTGRTGQAFPVGVPSGQVRRALEDALGNLRARPHAVSREEQNAAIPMVR